MARINHKIILKLSMKIFLSASSRNMLAIKHVVTDLSLLTDIEQVLCF